MQNRIKKNLNEFANPDALQEYSWGYQFHFDFARAAKTALELEFSSNKIVATARMPDDNQSIRVVLSLPEQVDVDRISSTLLGGQVLMMLPKLHVKRSIAVA